MPSPRLLPHFPASSSQPALLSDDLITGVDAIAAELGLDRLGKERGRKAIYKLREKRSAPIFKLPGIGLAARRSSLLRWIESKDHEASERGNNRQNVRGR